MSNIVEANKVLMREASRYLYIKDGRFAKRKPWRFTPLKHGIVRSTGFLYDKARLFFLDIDGKGLDEDLFEASRAIARAVQNVLGIQPLVKSSGSSGVHIIFEVIWDKNYEDHEVNQIFEDLAYTLFKLSGVSSLGFGCKTEDPTIKKPYIDTSSFKGPNRMMRGYCYHHKSGKYSVPMWADDTLGDVLRRMNTGWFSRPVTHIPRWVLNTKYVMYQAPKPKPLATTTTTSGARYEWDESKFVPNRFGMPQKFIDSLQVEASQDIRWAVVAWLRWYDGLTEEEIMRWLQQNTVWVSSIGRTKYHVRFTCKWVDRIQWTNPNKVIPIPTRLLQ